MRCADFHASNRQQGAAILLALVTMFVCVSLAAATVAQVGRSLDSAAGHRDLAQARLLARTAVDWARNVLADDRLTTAIDHGGQPWALKVPPTPVGDAEVSGEIQCWSARFNLNSLLFEGEPNPRAIDAFAKLLQAIDVPQATASQLAFTLARRLAPLGEDDPANRPHGLMVAITELAEVPGFDAQLIDRLSPFVAALPTLSRVNLNTAPAEVLIAITNGLALVDARALVAERETVWYRNVADYTLRLPEGVALTSPLWVDVRSRHFLVTGRANFGGATVNLEVLLDRADTWPDILWQRLL